MKTSRSQQNRQSKQGITHLPKPEIRDNLDSLKHEEQDDKGDDTTHNQKPHRNHQQKKKK